MLRTGSYLVFELKADKSIREGFIKEIQDSSLSFQDILFEGQVSLSQIKVLAGSSKSRVNAGRAVNIAGNVLLIAGLSVLDCGLDFMFHSDYYYWPIGASIWIAGAWIAGMGYMVDWASIPFEHRVHVRNYREWNASIVKEGSEPLKQIAPEQKNIPQQDSTDISRPPAKEKKITDDDVYGK